MRYIILISGYSKSGKDLMADYMVKSFNFKSYAIASSLKQMVAQKYNIDHNMTNTQEGKSAVVYNGLTVRELLINSAIELKDSVNQDVFIVDTCKQIFKEKYRNAVISDFRYINEYEYICKQYAYEKNTRVLTVRIDRFDISSVESPSENQLNSFNFNYLIENRSSVFDFYNKIDTFCKILNIV
jgi:archaellum biogenesis ATPase FlaH